MGVFRQPASFEKQRTQMVERQLRARGITDRNVLDAMRTIPREKFVPDRYQMEAYADGPVPIGEGQTISQPYMVALMTASLRLKGHEKVLEIGTGSGYQMAVLLAITPNVFSLERIELLAQHARSTLVVLGHNEPRIMCADGSCGYADEAPFDAILVTSAAPAIPDALKLQLADGGRLVIPVGPRHKQALYVVTRQCDTYDSEKLTSCVFVPLIGRHGWDS